MDINIIYQFPNIFDIYHKYVIADKYSTDYQDYQICKYCDETNKDKFKSKAHIIPEFMGNKDLRCYDECDKCNNIFSIYELSLKNFGAFKNSHLPISGKKKFPTYTDADNNFKIQFTDEKTLLTTLNKKDDSFIIDKNKVKITSKTIPFIPLHVYKCLVKIGLSLMSKEDFKSFATILPWLKDKNYHLSPIIPHTMLVADDCKPIIKPFCILLKRKNEYNCLQYSLVVRWGFYMFQIFLPFNVNDSSLDYSNLKLPILGDFIYKDLNSDDIKINHYDMNSLKKIQKIEKLSLMIKNNTWI